MKEKKISLGKAFSDSISQESNAKGSPSAREGDHQVDIIFGKNTPSSNLKISIWRLLPLYLICLGTFFILTTKLFNLQILEGNNFYNMSEQNRIRLKVIRAPRGVIYDRNGKVLAQNIPGFRVVFDPTKVKDTKSVVKSLAVKLKIPKEEIINKIIAANGPFTVKNEVDQDAIFTIESNEEVFPGVSVEVDPIRQYLYPDALSHLLGYTGEISQTELDQNKSYQAGDKIGKSGIEESYESQLRGLDGYELYKVSASGKKEGNILTTEPKAGKNITLSIDLDLELKMKEYLAKQLQESKASVGSAVAMDPRTGQVLGMVSLPSYDDNLFAKGISNVNYQKLINDPLNPLLNRVIGGAYPPGSIFKIVTSSAALEEGKINQDTKIEDTGYVQLGSIKFTNWFYSEYGRTEGLINIIQAIARSNDVFFYKVGQLVGDKAIQEWAKKFHLGERLGINLDGEVSGLVPTEEWKQKARGESWYPGETLNLSIGQGDLQIPPLQVVTLTSTVANQGKIMKPLLLKDEAPQVLNENFVSQKTLDLIKTGMSKVVQTGGTAWPFFDFKIPAAGKTGTAESGHEKPHGWFTVFAPLDHPQIAVTVIIENSGEGSNVSAPVARKILDYWFSRKN